MQWPLISLCLWVFLPGLRSSVSAPDVRLREIKRFAVPDGPKSIRFAPDGRFVVANCLYGHQVVVIDAATFQIVKKIPVPDEPVECAFRADGKLAWVSLYSKRMVLAIDLQLGKIHGSVKT